LQFDGIAVKRVGPRAPNPNALAERWVQSVRVECLDHFLVFGEAHLRHLLAEYLAYYHGERPHQALGNRPLSGPPLPERGERVVPGDIVCVERLGGLLKHYTRRAA
jgi:putative transposase